MQQAIVTHWWPRHDITKPEWDQELILCLILLFISSFDDDDLDEVPDDEVLDEAENAEVSDFRYQSLCNGILKTLWIDCLNFCVKTFSFISI